MADPSPLDLDAEDQGPHWPTPALGVIQPAAPARGFADVGAGRTYEVDVVVVGSGPGGASVAMELALAGARVLVLEEGPATSRFQKNQAHTARYHMQEGGAMVARGTAFVPIAAGRGVGGGTLINSALSFRTPDTVLDSWARLLGDDGWSAAAMAPIFDEVTARVGVGITPDAVAGENNRIIARGVAALGLSGGLAPRSTPGCAGCGACNFGCPVGGKASTNLTFLPVAVAHGAIIQAETRVDRLLVEGNRVVGVEGHAVDPDTGEVGGTVRALAPRVVLSAGGIGTPRLLWHSGLGERLGPVGEGLHIHPGNAVLGECDQPVHLWKGASQGADFHHPDDPGILPHTFTAPPEACLLATGMVGARLEEGLALLPRLCGCIVMISDHGTGRVRATPDGRADISYSFDPGDVARIKLGMALTARVLLAGGARRLTAIAHRVGWHTDAASLDAALAPLDIRDFTLYAAHPMSTCRMGLDPASSVVGPLGHAHRLEGLVIADASVYPTSLGVNPQITTMAVGTRIGRTLARAG